VVDPDIARNHLSFCDLHHTRSIIWLTAAGEGRRQIEDPLVVFPTLSASVRCRVASLGPLHKGASAKLRPKADSYLAKDGSRPLRVVLR
jgi:hypothetical protein